MLASSVSTAPRTEAHPSCPLCSKAGTIRHASVRDRAHGVPGEWSVRFCSACRIGWLDPQPINEDIGLCYPGVYYTHVGTHEARPSPFGAPGLKGKARDAILAGRYGYEVPGADAGTRALGRFIGAFPPVRRRVAYARDESLPLWRTGGSLLDIGCGSGGYIRLARSLGWRTYGIDPDPVAADLARASGAVVEVGTLDTVVLPNAPFDAVASMHSIEHARDPRRFLQQMAALLRPGGFFYLQTPNFGSLLHRRYGADWYALEISRHLCLLTVPAMRRLLGELGPWASLQIRSNPRRAVREQEQTLAMRREGSFEAKTPFSFRDQLGMLAWSSLERLGNRAAEWGEEIEVVGVKG